MIPIAEREALIALYNSTNGAGWFDRTNWRNAADIDFNDPGTECTWHGVTCDGLDASVIGISLTFNNLNGPIPPEVANCTNLQILDLRSNQLTGAIPMELGSLTNLQFLELFGNQLTGSIPEALGDLVNLWSLGFASNQLSGPIPQELGSLSDLSTLSLWGNQLSGSIPAELGSLSSLQYLWLSRNQLTGTIPEELGSLGALLQLTLDQNQLSGPIPPNLGNLEDLWGLDLSWNQLSGTIPTELADLASLETLELRGNQLTGTITPELSTFDNLWLLDLSWNQLSGTIPTELADLANLGYLALAGNQLTGAIPTELSSVVNLWLLDLSWNQLSGTIPTELADLANLGSLALAGNQLTGAIPAALSNLANLWALDVYNNQLTGTIPLELGSLTNLQFLTLAYNQLTGAIPAELENLFNLSFLILDGNMVTGTIPTELGNLPNLRYLGLGFNQLTGAVPTELGNLSNLWGLDLGGNILTGTIPTELGNLADLYWLDLGSNQLTDTIPPELGNLADLSYLYLHENQLNGEVPSGLRDGTSLGGEFSELTLYGNGCLASTVDATFTLWLDEHASGWDDGCDGRLAFDPSVADFGDVVVGATAGPQAVLLHNTDDAAATGLTFHLIGDGDFWIDAVACGGALPAGESCVVEVRFAPTEPGPAGAMVQVTSSEGATASVELLGNGITSGGATALALEVDPEGGFGSDGNRVFEPGETVEVAPTWRNDDGLSLILTGTAGSFDGPGAPAHYDINMASADYGMLDPGAAGSCLETDHCYVLSVVDPAMRPATRWVATMEESLSNGSARLWDLHIGDSFTDVPRASPFYRSIETMLHHEISGGCSATEYCPTTANTRGQMPVFVLRALQGSGYVPPPCVEGDEDFDDVPATSALCPWVEDLVKRGVVAGCGEGLYCPNAAVNRQQMAIFLLRTLLGPGYTPPPCSGTFADVPCTSVFAPWVEELAKRGVTGGCASDPLRYCPTSAVNRQQMAVFVTQTFELRLYGP